MEFICNVFGFVTAFLGVNALMRLPRYWKKGSHSIRKWLLSGAFKGFIYTFLGLIIALFVMFGHSFPYSIQLMILSGGSVLGTLLSFVISGYSLLKYQNKNDRESAKPKQERNAARGGGVMNEIRLLRIQIQEELKNKEQEARRMMNDTYLGEEAKAEILIRYRDCIKLLQELYAEASNVLAYLETNGSNFKFDLDSLYVSEDKQNDLQSQLDRLKAFRQLSNSGSDKSIEALMRKYDADFQRIRGQGIR